MVSLRARLATTLFLAGCAPDPDRPCALIVTLDTTRADALSCLGAPRGLTPHLDELARESVLYAEARTTAPITMPAHASMFTGLYPPRHTVRDNNVQALPGSALTLAELARSRGWQTSAFVASIALDRVFGLDQGFEVYDQPERVMAQSSPHAGARTDEEVVDAALAWLARRDRARPFLAWVHLYDPHAPYLPDEEHLERAGGRAYLGDVAAMDSAFGRLMAELRADRDWLRTVVVVMADHGEALMDHGEPTHGMLCYDATLRVPMLVRHPDGERAGEVSREIVSAVDLLPTVCEALGLPLQGDLDGTSLWSRPVRPERGVFFESYYGFIYYGWSPLAGWLDAEGIYLHSSRPLLFDPGATDGDGRAPSAGDGERVQRAQRALAEVFAAPALTVQAAGVDEATLSELRALGYAAGGGPAQVYPSALAFADRPSPNEHIEEHRRTLFAQDLMLRGEHEQAIEILGPLIRANPHNVRALAYLANNLMAVGRAAEAVPLLERVLASTAPTAGLHWNLAEARWTTGDHEGALAALRAALELDREHVQSLSSLVERLEELGRGAQADPYRARLQALQR
jgi:hypothetical protein